MAVRQLPERTNRGKRTKELIGEEKEVDDLFWKTNGVFVDEVDDEDYELEPEKEDKFDADFWMSESESQSESVENEEEKVHKPVKKSKKRPNLHKPAHTSKRLKLSSRPSQKELLEEAASTEMWNQYKLTQMLQFEEAKVQRLGVFGVRRVLGPTFKLIDTLKGGKRRVTLKYPPENPISPSIPAQKPPKTGKYRDPKTNKSYNTIEEFRKIRTEYANKQEAELQARIKAIKEELAKKRENMENDTKTANST